MDDKAILAKLATPRRRFPAAAVRAIIEQREHFTPILLDILEDVDRNPARYTGEREMRHLYAMHLLAQFREPKAYQPMVRIVSRPGGFAEKLLGDSLTESFGRMLAAVWGGDISGVNSLIENEALDDYVRTAGFDAHLTLVAIGERTRDETMDYFRSLLPRLRRKPSAVLDDLVCCIMDLHPADLMDHLTSLFKDGLIDHHYFDRDDLTRAYRETPEQALASLRRNHRPILDTAEEMSWWACFNQGKEEESDADLPPPEPISATIRREAPKVGRNDPCPCGSGKKHKKCCGV